MKKKSEKKEKRPYFWTCVLCGGGFVPAEYYMAVEPPASWKSPEAKACICTRCFNHLKERSNA